MTYKRSMGRWKIEKDILKRKGVDLAHLLFNATVWRYKSYVVTEVLYFYTIIIASIITITGRYIYKALNVCRALSILCGSRKRKALIVSVLCVRKLILGIGFLQIREGLRRT